MNGLTKEMIFGSQKKKNEQEHEDIDNIKEYEEQDEKNKVVLLEIHKMVDFRESQPFSLYSEEKLEQMKESILRNGIIVPIIVRKIEDEKYEIIAGHNRVRCARELEITKVPTIIMDVNDDEAKLIMLETNLCQRDNIPPVEKGYAYKMQLEILKKIREQEGVPSEHQKSIDNLASNTGDGRTTIQRLIRLTELIKPLQDKVNSGTEQVPIRAGVELSHLSINEQEIVNKILEENNLKIKVEQAEYLRSIKGGLTETDVIEIFISKTKEKIEKFTGKLNKETLKKYKEKFNSNSEFDELINRLLEEYFSKSEGDFI